MSRRDLAFWCTVAGFLGFLAGGAFVVVEFAVERGFALR